MVKHAGSMHVTFGIPELLAPAARPYTIYLEFITVPDLKTTSTRDCIAIYS